MTSFLVNLISSFDAIFWPRKNNHIPGLSLAESIPNLLSKSVQIYNATNRFWKSTKAIRTKRSWTHRVFVHIEGPKTNANSPSSDLLRRRPGQLALWMPMSCTRELAWPASARSPSRPRPGEREARPPDKDLQIRLALAPQRLLGESL